MFLEIFLESILFRNDFRVVTVIYVIVVMMVGVYVVVGIGVCRIIRDRNRDGFVFGVVELFVADVVQSEVSGSDRGVYGAPFPGAKA